MRGTGPVTFDGKQVYGYFTLGNGVVRVRVSVDEWDALGLSEGRRVHLGLPGRHQADVLVASARREPPFVWADMAVLVPAAQAG